MSEWYSDLRPDEFNGKHVRAVIDSGTVIEGCLEYWDSWLVTVGSPGEGNYVLRGFKENYWKLTADVERLDLVWDERDWEQIDAKDLRHGDAVVANGRLYKVPAIMPGPFYTQALTDTPTGQCIPMYLVSRALRRKVKVPSKLGYYRDRDGFLWARTMCGGNEPWQPIDQIFVDNPVMSDEDMASRMPLTLVHFESGRAA